MLDAFKSGGEVEKAESLKSKDFSIISYRASISSSYFAYIMSTAAMTAGVTALVTDCSTTGSMEL